jgi:hypothetical protein
MEHYSDPVDEMWTITRQSTFRGEILEALAVGRACECLDDVYPCVQFIVHSDCLVYNDTNTP